MNGVGRLGDRAYQAVEKHFKKSTKPEADVLADVDPEPLHQMRVGMRRLRTALLVFEGAIDLPKGVSEARIKKFAQKLGAVRDIDVLKAKLEERYRPDLEGKERKQLDKLLEEMVKQRRQAFAQVEEMLAGGRYQQFKRGVRDWLDEPQFYAVAALPIEAAVPDLLLPLISHLLLHPGWLVGAQLNQKDANGSLSTQTIQRWLDEQSESLHDLRKQMKRVRYQTEFFTEFYGDKYGRQVEDFQNIQEVLGQIQDYSILKEFLADALKSTWQKDLPTLAQRLEHEQTSLWQLWQPIQARYLDREFRESLRSIVLTLKPSSDSEVDGDPVHSQPRSR